MKKVLGLVAVFCIASSLTAHAKTVWEAAESSLYREKAAGMLGRGFLNATTCFVDMFVQAANGAKEGSPQILGAVGGFAKGSVCTVLRASSGVIDVATFWIPGFNGVPVCRGYDNCIQCTQETRAPAPIYVPQAPARAPSAPPLTVKSEPPRPPKERASPPAPKAEDRMKYVKK